MDEEIVDIYFRNIDIENLKEKIDVIKHNKNNAFIMIDGEWGSGKTTLLKLLKEEIKNNNNVIEYNCWENSFYPDPLIAIISSITDQTDENSDIKLMRYFKPSISEFSIGGLKIEWIRKKKNEDYKSLEKYIKDFRSTLNDFNENNNGIANKKTRIILVDELDRCLPEYAIKVLERLYLLLKNVNDVIVIIANNNEQLEYSVKKIFGDKINVNKYLEKFVDDIYRLKYENINKNEILNKFSQYFNKFSFQDKHKDEVKELFCYLIRGLKPRDIQRKIYTLNNQHDLIFDKENSGYICICEMFCVFLSIKTLLDTFLFIEQNIPTVEIKNQHSYNENYISNGSHNPVLLKHIMNINDYKKYLFEVIDKSFTSKNNKVYNEDIKKGLVAYLLTLLNNSDNDLENVQDIIQHQYYNAITQFYEKEIIIKLSKIQKMGI